MMSKLGDILHSEAGARAREGASAEEVRTLVIKYLLARGWAKKTANRRADAIISGIPSLASERKAEHG